MMIKTLQQENEKHKSQAQTEEEREAAKAASARITELEEQNTKLQSQVRNFKPNYSTGQFYSLSLDQDPIGYNIGTLSRLRLCNSAHISVYVMYNLIKLTRGI